MLYEELARARQTEFRAAEYTIQHRMEWAEISTIDRLEKALRAARSRFSPSGVPVLKTN